MIALLSLLAAGLVAGSMHVLSGPDHLAATASLGVGRQRDGWRVGALWGLGHAAGVAALAGAALLLRQRIDIEGVSRFSERLVGVALVGLGLWGLRRSLSPWLHAHRHRHGDVEHVHLHWHRPGIHGPHAGATHGHRHASLGMGLLHGMAGGTHLLGVLPTLALPTTAGALCYLAGFASGTVLSMALFTAVLSRSASLAGPAAGRAFLATFSSLAVVVGVFWLLPG